MINVVRQRNSVSETGCSNREGRRVQIEVFSSPGCSRCARVLAMLESITRDFGAGLVEWRKVDVLEELDYAVELGVLSLPAIAIDGELVFTSHTSARRLRDALHVRLKEQTE